MCWQHKNTETETLYLFEFFDKLGSFNTTLHIKADVHFDLSKGVSQFDNGNLAKRDTSSILSTIWQWRNFLLRDL